MHKAELKYVSKITACVYFLSHSTVRTSLTSFLQSGRPWPHSCGQDIPDLILRSGLPWPHSCGQDIPDLILQSGHPWPHSYCHL